MLCDNIQIRDGHLFFAGMDTVHLAEEYGTPLYLMDEDRIRERCRLYKSTMAQSLGAGSYPIYAGKASCFRQIYRIMSEEDMAIDLASAGEIYAASSVGFPLERAFFHGNNKTAADMEYALDKHVGCFIVDNPTELAVLGALAEKRGVRQSILLRLTPGIDPHTFEEVATGKVDSKFGVSIETGQAEDFVRAALNTPSLRLLGYHCHVGSQVFDEQQTVFHDTADIMLGFAAKMRDNYGFTAEVLNLGGGYGVRYTEDDPTVDIAENIRRLAAHMENVCRELDYPMPSVLMEPGRSIVADAGMTLYHVGAVKEIPGYKNYISVDGSMADNPRYALYESRYTVINASRADAPTDFVCDVVGRCCESGDILQPRVSLPKTERDDVIAVCTTGAYNHTMASNYNALPRPPIVMLRDGKSSVAVRRETFEDIFARDLQELSL